MRVRKNNAREHVRNSSRQNKEILSGTQGSHFLPELNDLNSREDQRSPMGSPKKLHMQNKIRNKNGPQMNFSDAHQQSVQSSSMNGVISE